MNIRIQPLTPELSADYFDFFENRAFTDNSPYRCYCQLYQMSKEQQKAAFHNVKGDDIGHVSRNIAKQQIDAGMLRGYLAFDDGVAIGWCNANDKANFPMESCTGDCFFAPAKKREMAVVCFEIAPKYRGKGIASALLQQVIDHGRAEGYIAVEGFPAVRRERFEWDCAGPQRLYEKAGFVQVAVQEKHVVMRKELK